MLCNLCWKCWHRFLGCPWIQCDIFNNGLIQFWLWKFNPPVMILFNCYADIIRWVSLILSPAAISSCTAFLIKLFSGLMKIPSIDETKTRVPRTKLTHHIEFLMACQKNEHTILTLHISAHKCCLSSAAKSLLHNQAILTPPCAKSYTCHILWVLVYMT